jgi:hypothetical protein
MNTDLSKPFILTGQHHNEKVTIEYANSDVSLDEFLEMFKSLAKAMGYLSDSVDLIDFTDNGV